MKRNNIRWNSMAGRISLFLSMIVLIACNVTGPSDRSDKVEYSRLWDDVARYLAGLEPGPDSMIGEYDSHPDAEQHRDFFNRNWPRIESEQLQLMREWSAEELSEAHDPERFIFYPFSGPDFLNIHVLYPHASEYLMFGLEPPGTAPDIRNLSLEESTVSLINIQRSLSSILNYSFFRTLAMREDLVRTELDGTVPVLLVFIARTGHEVLDIRNVSLGSDGKVYAHPNQDEDTDRFEDFSHLEDSIKGIRILFRKEGETRERQVTYYSLDVTNSGLENRQYFLEYIREKGPTNVYLKAASYLMYRPRFSQIKDLVLESDFILQDDSGIPLRYFDREKWELQFYGNYREPIPLFINFAQPELRRIYQRGDGVKPLPFGIGYQFQVGRSNLMRAIKKTEEISVD